jgi:hypothetical protein
VNEYLISSIEAAQGTIERFAASGFIVSGDSSVLLRIITALDGHLGKPAAHRSCIRAYGKIGIAS